MKSKALLLFIALLLTPFCIAATIITHDPETGLWSYRYELPPTMGGKDLSHVSMTVPCPEGVVGHSSTWKYKAEIGKDLFKFDNLKPKSFSPSFTIESLFSPVPGEMTIKAGPIRYTREELFPGCATIPEPKKWLLGGFGILFLALRRKRTPTKTKS